MKYLVCYWLVGEIVGREVWCDTLTEAHYIVNTSGAIRGYIEKGDTGIVLECFGDYGE